MVRSGTRPDEGTLLLLLEGHTKLGALDAALGALKSLRDVGGAHLPGGVGGWGRGGGGWVAHPFAALGLQGASSPQTPNPIHDHEAPANLQNQPTNQHAAAARKA
jgi:hypothetical protein